MFPFHKVRGGNDHIANLSGLFLELLLSFQLVLAIFFLVVERPNSSVSGPIGVGLCLFTSELATLRQTGGSLNPARSFGPEIIANDFYPHHWLYCIVLGGDMLKIRGWTLQRSHSGNCLL